MAVFSANFPELMETRYKQIFFKNFSMLPLMFTNLISRRKSTRAFEDRLRVAGLGTFQVKGEGAPIAFDDPVEGTRVRTAHTAYSLGIRSTWEAIEDDQWDVLNKMPADLGESARDHMERVAWDLLNQAYAGTAYTGLDGVVLFSTAHTNLRGLTGQGVTTNVLAPPMDLTQTGIETMLNNIRLLQTEEGRFFNVDHNKILFHPSNQHKAYVLLQTEYKSGSSDNDRSTVVSTRTGITPVEDRGVPYLTAPLFWSLHAAPGKNSLQWNDRAELFMDRAKDANTLDQLHFAVYRASVMFSEWRGNYGSNFV